MWNVQSQKYRITNLVVEEEEGSLTQIVNVFQSEILFKKPSIKLDFLFVSVEKKRRCVNEPEPLMAIISILTLIAYIERVDCANWFPIRNSRLFPFHDLRYARQQHHHHEWDLCVCVKTETVSFVDKAESSAV